jgi:acetyl-CoA acetyltransferase
LTGFTAEIVGIGTTEQSRDLSHRSGISLALEALRAAADDAGIALSEIDGISCLISDWPNRATLPPPPGPPQELWWARQLGRPLRWIAGNRGVPAILEAAMAIEHGLASTVAIISGQSRKQDGARTAAWSRPSNEFTEWTGSYTTVQYALAAQRYLHEYGDGALEAMARASATIRNYGSINPDAVFAGKGPYTAQDVLDSRMIASPLTLLMCSSVNDGGGAMILTSADRARDTRTTPVRIVTGGNQQPYIPYFDAPVLDAVPDEGRFAGEAMARAGVSVDDIDVVEFYDHFSIGVLMEFEMFGFCGRGEAADFVSSGVMELDGRFPTCTDGGNHSYSHNGNPLVFRPIEAVRQLRGDVLDPCTASGGTVHSHVPGRCRAVRDPELAFVSNPGPPTGGASFTVLATN